MIEVPPGYPAWAVGRHQDRVMIVQGSKPIAAFTAPQAAALAALLIKHACCIASGLKVVDKAIDEAYGRDELPPTPPPADPTNS